MAQLHAEQNKLRKNIFPFFRKNKESLPVPNSKVIILFNTEMLSTSSFFWNSKWRPNISISVIKKPTDI